MMIIITVPVIIIIVGNISLPETNIAPENRVSQKETVFQPSIFRGYASFRDCIAIITMIIPKYCSEILRISAPGMLQFKMKPTLTRSPS